MKKLCLWLLIAGSTSLWSQSVVDAARATREKKTSPQRTITSDDLDGIPQAVAESNWNRDLRKLENVFRDICADPQTNNGRELSAENKESLEVAVGPLRVRRLAEEKKLRDWKEMLARLDSEQDAAIAAAIPRDRAFSDDDRQRVVGIREDFKVRRKNIVANVEIDEKGYQSTMKDIVKVAEACPEAAKAVK